MGRPLKAAPCVLETRSVLRLLLFLFRAAEQLVAGAAFLADGTHRDLDRGCIAACRDLSEVLTGRLQRRGGRLELCPLNPDHRLGAGSGSTNYFEFPWV